MQILLHNQVLSKGLTKDDFVEKQIEKEKDKNNNKNMYIYIMYTYTYIYTTVAKKAATNLVAFVEISI